MPNFTFQLKDCAIVSKPYKNQAGTFLSGKLHWQEGTIDFQKNFHTFNLEAMAIIEAHHGPESRFKIELGDASLTKKAGKKGTDWENKFFEEIVIEKISVTNTQKFNARELVDNALAEQNSEDDDNSIPF